MRAREKIQFTMQETIFQLILRRIAQAIIFTMKDLKLRLTAARATILLKTDIQTPNIQDLKLRLMRGKEMIK